MVHGGGLQGSLKNGSVSLTPVLWGGDPEEVGGILGATRSAVRRRLRASRLPEDGSGQQPAACADVRLC